MVFAIAFIFLNWRQAFLIQKGALIEEAIVVIVLLMRFEVRGDRGLHEVVKVDVTLASPILALERSLPV